MYHSEQPEKNSFDTCPKTGKPIKKKPKKRWAIWLVPFTGFVALLWFLVRVIPKPSRATYPCQRVAFPLASGFIIWLTGAIGSIVAFRKAKNCLTKTRYVLAAVFIFISIFFIWVAMSNTGEKLVLAQDPWILDVPIGAAKGVNPGRVVWIHDPNATDWPYLNRNQSEHWYEHDHTDQAVVDGMMSTAIRSLAGEQTDVAAWDVIFRHFNQQRGKGDIGYRPGEKIGIKVNHTLSYNANSATMDKRSNLLNYIGNSPQLTIALLKQLIDVVGVAPGDISIGDPGRIMPNYWYDMVEPNCPGVVYIARVGGKGRTQSQWSSVEFNWSDPDSRHWAGVTEQDHIPMCFAQADYFINFPVMKSHNSGGITVCAKNHYGSLIRNPDAGDQPNSRNWYNMHTTLPNNIRGMGNYRCLVDLMGHEQLGGKTLLCLVDGLFAGINWDSRPSKWQMEPFNDDWPSSIFLSMDQVAIDSVCFDFLYTEWSDYPHMSGAHDYLHEAAMANNPPSGTFYDPERDGISLASLGVHEHWNNSTDKQYSRNLGMDEGIELIQSGVVNVIPCDFELDGDVDLDDLVILIEFWGTDEPLCDIAPQPDGDGIVDILDLELFMSYWEMENMPSEPEDEG
ncbi:MAG: DUF362 domain-containing protein [Phycisphaerales bacterium]|jgi:hypothetical protein